MAHSVARALGKQEWGGGDPGRRSRVGVASRFRSAQKECSPVQRGGVEGRAAALEGGVQADVRKLSSGSCLGWIRGADGEAEAREDIRSSGYCEFKPKSLRFRWRLGSHKQAVLQRRPRP